MSKLKITVGMGPPESESGWHPVRIGAGGWIIHMDIAADGEMVCGGDTYGAYRWNSSTSQWDQLITATSMGESTYKFYDYSVGCHAIAIAPSNTQRYYLSWNGYIYRTSNRGTSWTKTAFTRDTTLNSNDEPRVALWMAVDPSHADTVYFSDRSGGVWYTHDAGDSWSQVSAATIPTGTGPLNHSGIAFDSTGGVNGSGYTNNIIVPSWGNGVWRSTNAGSTWTNITGSGPTKVCLAQVAPDGVYYCGTDTAGNGAPGTAWKYDGSWTSLGKTGLGVVVDPSDSTRIILPTSQGAWDMYESWDRGATWIGPWSPGVGNASLAATDIPWLAWTYEQYWMTFGNMMINKVDGKLYFSQGIGVWKTTFPSTVVPFTFTSQSKGIENLWTTTAWSVPGGATFFTAWDRPVFRSTDPDVFPSTHGTNNTANTPPSIADGTSVEHAIDDSSFIVVSAGRVAGPAMPDGTGNRSAYSTDGGLTWTLFTSYPSIVSPDTGITRGHIAVSTKDNWVWAPAFSTQVCWYTKNRGVTWTKCPSPVNGAVSFLNNTNRHIVTADRVTANKFYLYVHVGGLGTGNLYGTTNGGDSWSLIRAGDIVSDYTGQYNAWLKAVPMVSGGTNTAGHLFYTSGTRGSGDHSNAEADNLFVRSTDGGANWTTVQGGGANILEVYSFGFGKEKPGGTYPTIFIAGFVNSVFGIWMSDDNCSTWTRLGNTPWPLDWLDDVSNVEGDMNVYGRCYVGRAGSGWSYYQP